VLEKAAECLWSYHCDSTFWASRRRRRKKVFFPPPSYFGGSRVATPILSVWSWLFFCLHYPPPLKSEIGNRLTRSGSAGQRQRSFILLHDTATCMSLFVTNREQFSYPPLLLMHTVMSSQLASGIRGMASKLSAHNVARQPSTRRMLSEDSRLHSTE